MKVNRVYNFSAGPAVLPEEVLKEAADEMLDYQGSGMSVMEMSHRSKVYDNIIKTAEKDLRELMNIPDNYKVMFLQGGASQQFAMIPMNLMKNKVADYIITGQWAKKAWKEACKYGKANAIASSEDKTFSYIPDCSDLPISEDADYVYICENNTIYGTKYKELPNTKGKTLVADVSSCFLSEPVDVTKYGVIYGGVQKNIGPAGVVIVIMREDLITEDVLEGTPTMLQYKTHADADSLYNTPPAYGIYICGKVFKWLKKMGGLEVMKKRNEEKGFLIFTKKMIMRLKDKTALVTGAASGNGRAIATLFAQEGAKVVLADINKEGVEQVTADLQQKGCEVLSVVIDVTKESDIERMVSTAISAFGRLDILINNTGIFDMLVPVADTDDALWEKVLSINLTAPMRAIRYTIPIFKEQGGGVIVNTASIAGLTGARGGGAAYVAS